MPASVKQMLESANQAVPKVSVDEARRLIDEEGALLVDVRDANELAQSGKLEGALNVSRGMVEFRADPELPYHNPEFRKERPVILYCASGGRAGGLRCHPERSARDLVGRGARSCVSGAGPG